MANTATQPDRCTVVSQLCPGDVPAADCPDRWAPPCPNCGTLHYVLAGA